MTLQQSFQNRAYASNNLLGRDEKELDRSDDSSFERDETQLNQQDSEPTPVSLQLFSKKKSLNKSNVVAPYDPGCGDSGSKKQKKFERVKK